MRLGKLMIAFADVGITKCLELSCFNVMQKRFIEISKTFQTLDMVLVREVQQGFRCE